MFSGYCPLFKLRLPYTWIKRRSSLTKISSPFFSFLFFFLAAPSFPLLPLVSASCMISTGLSVMNVCLNSWNSAGSIAVDEEGVGRGKVEELVDDDMEGVCFGDGVGGRGLVEEVLFRDWMIGEDRVVG